MRLIISIIGSITVSLGRIHLVDDTAEDQTVDVVDALFEMPQTLAAGFSNTADQHDAPDLL